MNEPKPQDREIEGLLRKAHLPGPSSPLRDRIMVAAGQAWDRTPAETPWQIPLRHLALSAAATFLIVSAANYFANRLITQTRPRDNPAGPAIRTYDVNDDLLGTWGQGTPYRWGAAWPGRKLTNGQTVSDRMEDLNQMLDALSQNGT